MNSWTVRLAAAMVTTPSISLRREHVIQSKRAVFGVTRMIIWIMLYINGTRTVLNSTYWLIRTLFICQHLSAAIVYVRYTYVCLTDWNYWTFNSLHSKGSSPKIKICKPELSSRNSSSLPNSCYVVVIRKWERWWKTH